MKKNVLLIAVVFSFTTLFGQTPAITTIGSQVWMAEDLNVTKYRNGDAIPEVEDYDKFLSLTTGAWCYHQKDDQKLYRLYNWYAVNDPRGLAPEGWKIPSSGDWQALVNYLGGGSVARPKLKSTTGWDGNSVNGTPAGNGTNESKFNAFPRGLRGAGGYADTYFKSMVGWWCSDEGKQQGYSPTAKCYVMNGNKEGVISLDIYAKACGISVRCIKDGQANQSNTSNKPPSEASANKNIFVGTYMDAFFSPEDAHPSLNFKGEDGKVATFTLADGVPNSNLICDFNLNGEEKTNKANVGKKYVITFEPKTNIEGVTGEIKSFQEKTDNAVTERKGKMGLVLNDVDDLYMKERNLSNKDGAIVEKVVEGGAGAEAGILLGDVFLSINGEKLNGAQNQVNKIQTYKPGDKLNITLIRNGVQMTKTIILK